MFCESLTKCQYQGANSSYKHPTQKLCKPADESVQPETTCSIFDITFFSLFLDVQEQEQAIFADEAFPWNHLITAETTF